MQVGKRAWVWVGLLVLAGCAKPVSNKSYNQLVEQYNDLLNASYALHESSHQEERGLGQLNDSLSSLSDDMQTLRTVYLTRTHLTATEQQEFDALRAKIADRRTQVYAALSDLEAQVLAQAAKLDEATDVIIKEPGLTKALRDLHRMSSGLKDSLEGRSKALNGIRKLVEEQTALADQHWQAMQIAGNQRATPLITVPKIELTEKDRQIANNVSSGSSGFVRDGKGTVQSLSDLEAVKSYAERNGFNSYAAVDASKMSRGGLVSFAQDPTKIPEIIGDMIGHIKPALNRTTGDLEVAFVIDYSGSMSDDIESVVKGLVDITKSFENVKVSGRSVKIALVTFGESGKEKLELNLTGDMVKVASSLKKLLSDYSRNQHSTDPGEASYHGLQIAAEKVSWSSSNRMAIVITDEPSYELQTGNQRYVDSVTASLNQRGVDSRIYTIVVK